ncbi:transposase [Streptomyces sp. NPDC086519]|uniref:transposase n=1 Tax=Streptomyces sp. NPDC086519 TaxID=3154863 RepID=UPI00342C8DCF
MPDELCTLFRRVVPPTEVKRRRAGGDAEQVTARPVAAVIFVAASGCTWRQLPPVFRPTWPTGYRCFAQWRPGKGLARLHRVVLDELGDRGQLDWPRGVIDSVGIAAALIGYRRLAR